MVYSMDLKSRVETLRIGDLMSSPFMRDSYFHSLNARKLDCIPLKQNISGTREIVGHIGHHNYFIPFAEKGEPQSPFYNFQDPLIVGTIQLA